MSEFIDNSTIRQEQLKKLIKELHNGMPLDEAKAIFKEQFETVSTEEITTMEQALIEEGMPIDEVQKLCDVHSALFNGSIADIHGKKDVFSIPGHPVRVFSQENERLTTLLEEEIKPYVGQTNDNAQLMLRVGLERLYEIRHHYARKESLFFPGLEKRGLTSIPKVMWGVDNDIRDLIRGLLETLGTTDVDLEDIQFSLKQTISKVEDMITKEENILLPLLADTLSLYDWILADEGSDEIGYFLEAPTEQWSTLAQDEQDQTKDESKTNDSSEVLFDAGTLLPNEINAIFNTVPFDMTFVDKDGHVKYFTQGKERIFDRPKTIIGRHVNMCHPPQSVHVVDDIVKSFESGEKDHEDFWIDFHNMFVHIRYYAVRDKDGSFLGTLEVTQDVKPIRDLTGEKRLVE